MGKMRRTWDVRLPFGLTVSCHGDEHGVSQTRRPGRGAWYGEWDARSPHGLAAALLFALRCRMNRWRELKRK